MPASRPVVGPVPDGMDPDAYDRQRRRVMWTMPSGLYVVGARSTSGDRRNLMTLNWATQLAFEPKYVGISIETDALTHRLVAEAGVFALSILDRAERALVRKFVKPLEDDGSGVLGGVAVHPERTGAPVLDGAVAFVDCEVRDTLALGSHDLFVGEVVDARFLGAEDRPVLRMEDTRMSYGG